MVRGLDMKNHLVEYIASTDEVGRNEGVGGGSHCVTLTRVFNVCWPSPPPNRKVIALLEAGCQLLSELFVHLLQVGLLVLQRREAGLTVGGGDSLLRMQDRKGRERPCPTT